LASSSLKPYTGFANLRSYPTELQRDFRELDIFLRDLRANVGKLLGESSTEDISITAVTTDIEVIAGAGLTGGGQLTGDVTLAVGAGTGITVTADAVSVSASFLGANPTATIGLAAIPGTATTYMRSDGAPPLGVGITPTWTAVHIFSAQDVHNAGVSLGTNGILTSALATDNIGDIALQYKPGNALTSSGSRFLHAFKDSAGTQYFDITADGSFYF